MQTTPANTPTYTEAWIPESHISQHNGTPIPHNAIFFAAPPTEIGTIVTAQSNLNSSGKRSRKISRKKLLNAISFGVALGFITSVFLLSLASCFFNIAEFGLIWGLSGVAGLLVAEALIKFSIGDAIKKSPIFCSYIGDQGIAQYEWQNGRSTGSYLEFSKAHALRRNVTMKDLNNAFQETIYSFTWLCRRLPDDTRQDLLFSIQGSHESKSNAPPNGDHYYFAIAAEQAWTEIFLKRSQAELSRSGILQFALASGKILQLEPSFLSIISSANQITQFKADELQIENQGGNLTINQIDPSKGWTRADGVRHGGTIGTISSFNVADLDNANAFLICANLLLNPAHA